MGTVSVGAASVRRAAARRAESVVEVAPAASEEEDLWEVREVGATDPLFDPKTGRWDPLLLGSGPNASKFEWNRAAEVQHGRVAMLAVLGLIFQSYGKLFPGMEGVPTGLGAPLVEPASTGFAYFIVAWRL